MKAGTRRFPPCATPRRACGIAPGHVRDMAVQEGRSKDRVVRLEPFFTDGAVAALDRPVPDTRNSPASHGIRLVPAVAEGPTSGGPRRWMGGSCGLFESDADPFRDP